MNDAPMTAAFETELEATVADAKSQGAIGEDPMRSVGQTACEAARATDGRK